MSKKGSAGSGRRKARLYLTERALEDLIEFEVDSVETCGRRVATKYLAGIESALRLVQENPALLTPLEGIHDGLRHYLSGSHVLIFDVRPASLVLLTVVHGSRDVPSRLAELAPTLSSEVEALHRQLPG